MKYTKLMMDVYNALGLGSEKARTRKELCAALGCNDRERDDGTGYYIPTPDSRGRVEASMWLSRQNKRQKSIKRATRGARLFVAQRQEG